MTLVRRVEGLGAGGRGILGSKLGIGKGRDKLGSGIEKPPVGLGTREKLNEPVGNGGNEKLPVGRGKPEKPGKPVPVGRGKLNLPVPVGRGKLNEPVGNGGNEKPPVGRGKLKLPLGIGKLGKPGSDGLTLGLGTEEGAEKLGKVVPGVGKERLPPGRVDGGNGRTGMVVGRENGGRLLLLGARPSTHVWSMSTLEKKVRAYLRALAMPIRPITANTTSVNALILSKSEAYLSIRKQKISLVICQ